MQNVHMVLRKYQKTDVPILARLYREAVLTTGRSVYSARQVEVWASLADDIEAFRKKLSQGVTLVALEGSEIVGFGQLDPPDRVALLITAPQHGRKRVATTICLELERLAIRAGQARLRTEASRVARPLFARLGFVVESQEQVEFKGVAFERFRMSKNLASKA